MNIVLRLDQPLPDDVAEHDLALLLRDALGEFIAARSPVERYVATRYAKQSDAFRARKVAEVTGRLSLAARLKACQVTLDDGADK